MEFEIINPLNYDGWDDLLVSNHKHCFFHYSPWNRVLHEAYQYEPLYLTAINHGKLQALIPCMEIKSFLTGRRGVCLPFTDYCDPFWGEDITIDDTFNYLANYGKQANWKYIEIRDINNSFRNFPRSSYYWNHTLDINKTEDQLFSGLRTSTKRNIKKAIKADVEVVVSNTRKSMKEFYRLNCMTRKKNGLPPQPYLFFDKIYQRIISKDKGLLIIARHDGKVVAGALYLHAGKRAIYKYGASDARYNHLRHNNLVMWEAIKWYMKNGYRTLCFGRTDPVNTGLRNYKLGWGTEEKIINYYKFDLRNNAFVEGNAKTTGFHNKIFRLMPVPLLRLVGAALYRHVG
ncbi:MAG: GNAT family N-acetyltransferase [Desulfobacteraceae bacterium]|nr:GNAT family N-acetyltransferase [Desulfobacteraceae bacterium]